MWEKTEITSSNDHTIMIPTIPNDVMADKMKPETEEDRLAQAKNRGITIGVFAAVVAGMILMCGIGIGAFLVRVLVL